MAKDDKIEALKSAMAQIEKNFGKGSIMKLGEGTKEKGIKVIPTGSIALDIALGLGGIPRGRIIEIYGPESSGKTTLVQHIIAEVQKQGGTAAFIDAEHALDPVYAEKTGVDVENLLVSQPDTGEQALEIAETLIRSGAVDLIAIDSVAALTPRAEIEGEMGDSHMGLQARLMSQALRKITSAVSRSNCVVIFTNQIRMKIGIMFGNPETTPGGNALKFYASIRMEIRRVTSIKEGDVATGNRVRVKVVKNKVAPPFRVAEFDIMFNEGISKSGNLIDVGVEMGVVEKAGAWFSYKGEKISQGREAAKQFLKDNPKVMEAIEKEIREKAQNEPTVPLEIGEEKTKVKIETLHSHTTTSDGQFSHLEVLKLCAKYNIGTVAFTDHDSLPSERVLKDLKTYKGPINWVCGIEMSTTFHMVGLFVNPTNKNLKEHCIKAQEARIERMQNMVKNLNSLGFKITTNDCLKASGGETVGRPHIVQALNQFKENLTIIEELKKQMEVASKEDPKIALNYKAMIQQGEAQYPYKLFLSDDSFINNVYVETGYKATPKQCSKLIRDAGGLAIFAHYSTDRNKISHKDLENYLKDNILDGIETVYGLYGQGTILEKEIELVRTFIRTILKKYNKVASGGADAHTEEDFKSFAKAVNYNKETIGMAEKIIKQTGVSTQWSSL